MCVIGCVLMVKLEMILFDELLMGLVLQIVEEIFEIVKDLNGCENVSFLLVEQNMMVVLRYVDFGYILENGWVVMEGDVEDLWINEDVKEFYLGLSLVGRKFFKDVKYYRCCKCWFLQVVVCLLGWCCWLVCLYE